MSNENKLPIHRIRYGAVSVAIWENQGSNGTFHNATVERTYRDGEDNAKSTSSFGLSDIALLQLALAEAAQWINAQKAQNAQNAQSEERMAS